MIEFIFIIIGFQIPIMILAIQMMRDSKESLKRQTAKTERMKIDLALKMGIPEEQAKKMTHEEVINYDWRKLK